MNGIPYIPECEDTAGGSRLLLDFSTSTGAFEERYIEFFGVTAKIVREVTKIFWSFTKCRFRFVGFLRIEFRDTFPSVRYPFCFVCALVWIWSKKLLQNSR